MTDDTADTDTMFAWEKLEGWDRTFAQMWELFFRPEIEQRQTGGLLPESFSLYMGQILFLPTGKKRVLLNDEVRGEGLLRAPRAIRKGDLIRFADMRYIEQFELTDELLDNGHFTIIHAGDGWRMFFDFRTGRAKARAMLTHARQFLEAAQFSKDNGYPGPAVDNLFSASELISKAYLIVYRSHIMNSKTHGVVASEINLWARMGNIDAAFVALFNKLSTQRPNARYCNNDSAAPIPDQQSFDLVRVMIEKGLERVGKATDPALKSDTIAG